MFLFSVEIDQARIDHAKHTIDGYIATHQFYIKHPELMSQRFSDGISKIPAKGKITESIRKADLEQHMAYWPMFKNILSKKCDLKKELLSFFWLTFNEIIYSYQDEYSKYIKMVEAYNHNCFFVNTAFSLTQRTAQDKKLLPSEYLEKLYANNTDTATWDSILCLEILKILGINEFYLTPIEVRYSKKRYRIT